MTNGKAPPSGQDSADDGWAILSTLISGIALWSAVGWLVDRFWLHSWGGLLAGMLLGFAGSMYLIIHKYGKN